MFTNQKRIWRMIFGLSLIFLFTAVAQAGFLDDLKKAGEDTQKGYRVKQRVCKG